MWSVAGYQLVKSGVPLQPSLSVPANLGDCIFVLYISIAFFRVVRSEILCESRPFFKASLGFRTNTRATERMAIMPMTINNSNNVKPF